MCNDLVERANSIVVNVLKKVAADDPQNWDVHLPNTLMAINATQQTSTKYSPFFLLHGYEPRLQQQLFLGAVTDSVQRKHQLDFLLQARRVAQHNVELVHDSNARRFNNKRLDQSFDVGDLVLHSWPQASDHKLTPKFKGPYRIVGRVGAVCYKITDINDDAQTKTRIVHVQTLKSYKPAGMDMNQ